MMARQVDELTGKVLMSLPSGLGDAYCFHPVCLAIIKSLHTKLLHLKTISANVYNNLLKLDFRVQSTFLIQGSNMAPSHIL
jgi:hypothetical protein